MSKNYVFLDFDGVVVISDHLHYEYNQKVCDEYNLVYNADIYEQNHRGKKSINFYKDFKLSKWMGYDEFSNAKSKYIESNIKSCEVNYEVIDALRYFKAKEIPVYLLSSNKNAYEHIKLFGYEQLITGEVLTFDKSNINDYYQFENLYGLKLIDAISLEDSENIMKVQRSCGVNVIAIPSEYDIIELIKKYWE